MLPLILKNSDYPWSPWSLLEFLAASGRKEGKEHSFIRNKDIVLSKDGLKITLWKTKTDNKNIGVNKFIANLSGCLINPCNLVKGLKIARRLALKPEDPFFVTPNGKPISRDLLVKFIQNTMKKIYPAIPSSNWNGISLRKGGATSAMRAGINGETIKKIGNSASSAYKSYINHTDSDIKEAQYIWQRMPSDPL